MLKNKSWVAGVIVGIVLTISVIYCGIQVGCQSAPKDAPLSPSAVITNVRTDVKASTATIEQTTASIKKSATDGQAVTPPSAKNVLDPYWLNILFQTGTQEKTVSDLKSKDEQLASAAVESDKLKTFASSETNRANKAESSETKLLRDRLGWLVVAGVLVIGVGGVLVATGKPFGIAIGVGGALITVVALFIAQIAALIPWIVGGVVLCGIGYAIWYIYNKRKEAVIAANKQAVAKKAIVQLVRMHEGNKQIMTEDHRKIMYGNGALPGLAETYLDAETKNIVTSVRNDLPSSQKAPKLAVRPCSDSTVGIVDAGNGSFVVPMKTTTLENMFTCKMA